jgi:hypothetical protein
MSNYVAGLARRAAGLRPAQAPRPALGPGMLPFSMAEGSRAGGMTQSVPARRTEAIAAAPLPAPKETATQPLAVATPGTTRIETQSTIEKHVVHKERAVPVPALPPVEPRKEAPAGKSAGEPRTAAPQPPAATPVPVLKTTPASPHSPETVPMKAPPATTVVPPPLIRPAPQQPPPALRRSPAASTKPARQAAPPDIHVRIGRVEIRAVMPPAAVPAPMAPRTPRGFDDLASARRYLGR